MQFGGRRIMPLRRGSILDADSPVGGARLHAESHAIVGQLAARANLVVDAMRQQEKLGFLLVAREADRADDPARDPSSAGTPYPTDRASSCRASRNRVFRRSTEEHVATRRHESRRVVGTAHRGDVREAARPKHRAHVVVNDGPWHRHVRCSGETDMTRMNLSWRSEDLDGSIYTAADHMLPVQFAELLQRPAERTPEQRLMAAVLVDVIRAFCESAGVQTTRAQGISGETAASVVDRDAYRGRRIVGAPKLTCGRRSPPSRSVEDRQPSSLTRVVCRDTRPTKVDHSEKRGVTAAGY